MLSPSKKQQLLDLFAIQSESYKETRMIAHIIKLCKDNGWHYTKDKHNNVYVTKGQADLYPCVASHTDTVHSIVDGKIYPIIIENTLMCVHPQHGQVGTGGDDKCGIWVCLEMLERLPVCKVVFFAAEEVGCAGSSKADMKFFADCAFVIQVDRKGNDDFVIEACGTDLCSDDFALESIDIMKQHNYDICEHGGLTDVVTLVDNEIGISCINLSGGYYDPHTKKETVHITDLLNVTDMVYALCTTLGDRKWSHVPTKSYGYGNHNYDNWYKDYKPSYVNKAGVSDYNDNNWRDRYDWYGGDDFVELMFGIKDEPELYDFELDYDSVNLSNKKTGEWITWLELKEILFYKDKMPSIYKTVDELLESEGLVWNL